MEGGVGYGVRGGGGKEWDKISVGERTGPVCVNDGHVRNESEQIGSVLYCPRYSRHV